jgi:hypothetical protein
LFNCSRVPGSSYFCYTYFKNEAETGIKALLKVPQHIRQRFELLKHELSNLCVRCGARVPLLTCREDVEVQDIR